MTCFNLFIELVLAPVNIARSHFNGKSLSDLRFLRHNPVNILNKVKKSHLPARSRDSEMFAKGLELIEN